MFDFFFIYFHFLKNLVYDTYQPILGYSNYLILGVTAAMAWELPSKPIYLDEELRESYQMDNLPLLNRNDKNISTAKYTILTKQQPNNSNYYYTNLPKKQQNNYFISDKYSQRYPSSSSSKLNYNKNYVKLNSLKHIDSSNKIENYVLYADKLMKQFKELTNNIPQNRPLNAQDFQAFTDM